MCNYEYMCRTLIEFCSKDEGYGSGSSLLEKKGSISIILKVILKLDFALITSIGLNRKWLLYIWISRLTGSYLRIWTLKKIRILYLMLVMTQLKFPLKSVIFQYQKWWKMSKYLIELLFLPYSQFNNPSILLIYFFLVIHSFCKKSTKMEQWDRGVV